ncbi:MAG: insulinase family protein [Lewinellaceae bacterium]|nr:insulinase family protein [Phaeodactylibacter sp.]MCB9350726.1 insulinase family protein [Lewinellaceae bacterium]
MKNIKLILALVAVFAVRSLWAQDDDFRKTAPAPGPAPKIQFGEYEEFTLDNGLQVIVVENHKLPRIAFNLLVDVPPVKEGEFAGAAEMAGDMLGRGTESRSKAEIDAAVDFIGAEFSTDENGISGACLTRHKDKLLEVMADVLLHPAFPEEEFEKLKKNRLSELSSQEDDPNFIAGNVAQVLRFGEHPYGEAPTEQSIEAVTIDRCKAYYTSYFMPNTSYLAIIGDIKMKEAKEIAEKYFGAWEKGTLSREFFKRPEAPSEPVVAFVDKPGAVQSVIDITYPVNLKPGSEDVIITTVLNTLLGSGGLNSRLNSNIREDKGYSYGVRSTLNSDKYVGYFSAGGSVRNEVTDSAIVQFLYEMNRMRDEAVSAQELQSTKNYITGFFARAMERPETVARLALNTARYKLPKDYYANYLKNVNAVTAEQLQEAARKYILPGQAYIVVVGNKAEVADKLGRFAGSGAVTFFDLSGNPLSSSEEALPEGLTALDVVNNYLAAIGGREQLEAVKDLTLNMSTTVQGMAMQMTLQRKPPEKMAMKVEMNGMVVNETRFDGKRGLVSAMGQEQKLEGEDAESMKSQAMIFPELHYGDKGYELVLDGVEPLDGKKAYRILATEPSGEQSTSYYDVQTGLKVKVISTRDAGPQGPVTVTNELSDYKEVDGIRIPHEMKTSGMAPFPLTMKVESVAVNSGLSDDIFTVEE